MIFYQNGDNMEFFFYVTIFNDMVDMFIGNWSNDKKRKQNLYHMQFIHSIILSKWKMFVIKKKKHGIMKLAIGTK